MRVTPPRLDRRALLVGMAGLSPATASGQASVDEAGRKTRMSRGEGADSLLPELVGSGVELFVDRHRIAGADGVVLRLHHPRRAQVAVAFDRPWEGSTSAYVTVFEDEGRYRMYYRGSPGGGQTEQTCYAESPDGINWVRPELGIFDWRGSRGNNIVLRGVGAHNFAPFKDSRPGVPASERYKALGRGTDPKDVLHAFVSENGIRWRPASPDPVFTQGRFDSQNVAFWDSVRGKYRCYFRTPYRGVRGIGVVESADFLRWAEPRLISLHPPDAEHFYTNGTIPYFRNPEYRLAFPKRYLPDRQKLPQRATGGISDAVLLSSRDGLHFDRTFMEAWLKPGPDPRNWGDRSTMPAWGLLRTGAGELSAFVGEHYRLPTARLRRVTMRLDGFASASAGAASGSLVTTPLRYRGSRLVLNYATSAAGSLRVELQDAKGRAVPGFSLAEAPSLYGDAMAEAYTWKKGADVSKLAGRRIRLHFFLQDCDLYSYRFAQR